MELTILEQKIKIALWPKENMALEASICSSVIHAMNFHRLFVKRSGPVASGKIDPNNIEMEEYYNNRKYDYCEFYKNYPEEEKDEAYKTYMAELKGMANEFLLLLKSLNWFADIVRRDHDPTFFKIDGKFVGNKYNKDSIVGDNYDFLESEKETIIEQYKRTLF